MAESLIEKFTKDIEYNKINPLMINNNDETLGIRVPGGFVRDFEEDGHQCREFILDNGNNYIFDIEENTLYDNDKIHISFLFHKYIEKLIYDFSAEHSLSVSFQQCDRVEINAMPFVRLVPDHNERIIYLTNILVPVIKRHNNLGKYFISRLFKLCQKYGYSLILLDVLDRFKESLEKRGARVFNNDSVEITKDTDLSSKY